MTISELKLGVIGAGRISQVAHLPAASKAQRVRLTAICDASTSLSAQVARQYSVAGFTDVGAFLAADVDAVVVATPDRSHFAIASQAFSAGKHVLVEKPLAESSADAEWLAKQAERAGCKLQVGAMKRHDPGIEYAKSSLPLIGPLLSVQAWYRVMSSLRPLTEATLFPVTVVDEDVRQVEASHKADRQRYLLTTHGAHVFDSVRYLAGEVESVRADVAVSGRDYSWHGICRLAGPLGLASFEISANVHSNWSEGFELYGERGHISIRSHFPFFRMASSVQVYLEDESVATVPSFGDTDPYKRQLESFARSVLDDAPTNPDGWEGAAAVRFIEAVRASVGDGGAEVTL